MEQRIKELEDLVASLEKQVWALTDIVQLLAEDAIDEFDSGWSQDDKEYMKSLLKKI
jgi:exonuclease VII small subunit